MKNNYDGQFDIFSKIEVNGDNAHPLYKYMKHKQSGFLGRYVFKNYTIRKLITIAKLNLKNLNFNLACFFFIHFF